MYQPLPLKTKKTKTAKENVTIFKLVGKFFNKDVVVTKATIYQNNNNKKPRPLTDQRYRSNESYNGRRYMRSTEHITHTPLRFKNHHNIRFYMLSPLINIIKFSIEMHEIPN